MRDIAERKIAIADHTFYVIIFLIFLSFFEESLLPGVSAVAFLAMLLIPFVIFYAFFRLDIRINRNDGVIILAFILFFLLQIMGIRFDSFYRSVSNLYRTVSCLTVVLYIRHFGLTSKKARAFHLVSVCTVVAGAISFIAPQATNGNIFFGNYNTVGSLYFTMCVLNLLIYLQVRKRSFVLLALCDVILIIVSVTRTALLLLLIAAVLFLLLRLTKRPRPAVFLGWMIPLLVLFVVFYYNIKESGLYDLLNQISKSIFGKNFDSGRPNLWHDAVDLVGENWLMGLGTGTTLEEYYPWLKTSHSVFFEIYLQNGIVGTLAYILMCLVCIGKKGRLEKQDFALLVLTLAFIILFYNAVGIVLTKPRSGIGLLQWAILGLPYMPHKKSFKGEVKV